jgi:type II secretory pathway pseudopilin PulG
MPVIARFRTRGGADEGFTLIELTVAMVVTMLVMSSLIIVFLGSIRGVALAKQRQAATALATSTMEQFRALDYGTLSAGLYCSDLVGDTNITIVGTCGAAGATVTLAVPGTSISETVKVQTGTPSGTVGPVYPHIATKAVENVNFKTKAYVTVSPTTPAAFNLTVLVSWSSNVSKGTKTVTQRSTEFSPSRCLSSATHPYSGACQAAFNGDAGFSSAVISVTNTSGDGQDIPGFGGSSVQLALGALSSTLGVEQISKLTGKAQTTSATAVTDSGATSTGGVSGAVAADSDPSSATNGTSTATVSQSSVSTVSISGGAGVLGAVPASGGSGSLDARVSSTTSSCLDAAGVGILATNRPCTWGSRQSAGTGGSVTLQLPNGAPNFTIASASPAAAPSRSTVAVIPGSGGTACPTASGAGCITAQSSRSMGVYALGGLPTPKTGDTAPPANWNGALINLSGVVENAYAESGIGARTPKFTRSAGTLTYYDQPSASYKTVDMTALAADTAYTVAPVTATFNQGGHVEAFSVSASFTLGASTASASTAADPACKTTACTASATPSSTLRATVVYSISMDGIPTTSFAVSVDLGNCVARTSYTAAFDA